MVSDPTLLCSLLPTLLDWGLQHAASRIAWHLLQRTAQYDALQACAAVSPHTMDCEQATAVDEFELWRQP